MARHEVHMGPGHTYNPPTIRIHINDEVVWINDGGTHNAKGDNGTPDGFSTEDPIVGTSAPQKFTVLSTDPLGFKYSCTAHHPTDMFGRVIVVPAGTPLTASAKKAANKDEGSY
jgi:plastocyanin